MTDQISLLSPIGNHRRAHITPSKGKRKKRAKIQGTDGDSTQDLAAPPKPAINDHISIGLTSVTKSMVGEDGENNKRPCMIFVARGAQSSAFNCHFPKMVASATRPGPSSSDIRLVGFSRSSSDRLSECLGIARVSSLAVFSDAPGCAALWEMVKKVVPKVDSPWLEKGAYLPTKINTIHTTVGVKRERDS